MAQTQASALTVQQFQHKWRSSTLKERSASQSHFNDLCRMLGLLTPTDADPTGSFYTFERGAEKTDGGAGWADVWYRGHFAWEYKGHHADLKAAYRQLLQYREDLENLHCWWSATSTASRSTPISPALPRRCMPSTSTVSTTTAGCAPTPHRKR